MLKPGEKVQIKDVRMIEFAFSEAKLYFEQLKAENQRIVDQAHKMLGLVFVLTSTEIGYGAVNFNLVDNVLAKATFFLGILQAVAVIPMLLTILKPVSSYGIGIPPKILVTKPMLEDSYENNLLALTVDLQRKINAELARNEVISAGYWQAICLVPAILAIAVILFIVFGIH